jgi:hypothetical protein
MSRNWCENVPEAAPPSLCPLSQAWQSGWRRRPHFGCRCQKSDWSSSLLPMVVAVEAVGAACSRWSRLGRRGLGVERCWRRTGRGLSSASRGVGGRRARHRCRTRRRRRRRRGSGPGWCGTEVRRMRLWSGMTEEASGGSWLLRWAKGRPPRLGR